MKKEKWIRFIVSVLFAVASILCSYWFVHELKQGAVFAAVFLALGLFPFDRIPIPEKLFAPYLILLFLGSAFVAAFLSQFLLNEALLALGARRAALGIMICLALLMLVFLISLRYKGAICVVIVLAVLMSTVNHYVYVFKGNEFQPSDFFAVQAAWNVSRGYKYTITPNIFYAFSAAAIYLFFIFSLPNVEIKRIRLARLTSALVCLALILLFPYVSRSVYAQYFLQTGSSKNGFLLNFVLQMKPNRIDAPSGYSAEAVEELSDRYPAETEPYGNYPDIIVIMDESFANLEYIADNLHTNMEITPYIDSLKEQTIHGYVLSSVFGGGTPNSEYEFLTGNSLFFMPEGTYVFSQYIKSPVYSMVSKLNSMGYRTIGMHPYYATGWNRDKIYPLLGFDECHFLDDFEDKDKIRKYTSDHGMFERIIEYYTQNQAENGDPLFLFGVTMQNHGGYHYEGADFTPTVEIDGFSQDYALVEQYLTLIHETDLAMPSLISFFESVDRDVVIVFFGDHYPSLENEFYWELYGGPFSTLDEQELQYAVPFFIWTNYSTDSQEISLTSLNFLSNYVYDVAGIPLPPYNRFLMDVQSTIPAMNSRGFYSVSAQRFLTFEEASGKERSLLEQYNILQYNSLFDLGNLGKIFR